MKSEKAKTNRITGEVTSLDAKAGTFAVKTKDKEINLTADSKSTKGTLEKLNVSDKVTVSYTEKDGKLIASSVKAESKTTAAKPEKATEKKSRRDGEEIRHKVICQVSVARGMVGYRLSLFCFVVRLK